MLLDTICHCSPFPRVVRLCSIMTWVQAEDMKEIAEATSLSEAVALQASGAAQVAAVEASKAADAATLASYAATKACEAAELAAEAARTASKASATASDTACLVVDQVESLFGNLSSFSGSGAPAAVQKRARCDPVTGMIGIHGPSTSAGHDPSTSRRRGNNAGSHS